MTSATLSLKDNYAVPDAATAAATSAAQGAGYAASYLETGAGSHWLRRPGAIATVAIHGAALLAVWSWSGAIIKPAVQPPVIELIRIVPEPKQEITPPKPEPVKEKQVALALPKPVAPPLPALKPVDAAAAQDGELGEHIVDGHWRDGADAVTRGG